MTTDGSTGRRDGFNRWVASMKSDHEPLPSKPAALKPPVGKLELELDDNATHVHRIPKELIHRMREREQQPPPEPPPAESTSDDEEEDSHVSPLGMVQEDRTAVFRPPPELLARAKRMKAPPKPDAQASVPTKPPPAMPGEAGPSLPGAPKTPGFEAVPAAAKGGFSAVPVKAPLGAPSPARAPLPAVAQAAAPVMSSASVAETPRTSPELVDFAESLGGTAAALAAPPPSSRASSPASSPEPTPDSSAVFARREPASGVLPLPTAPVVSAAEDNDEPDTREYRIPEFGLGEPAPTASPVATPLAASAEPQPVDTESLFAFDPPAVPILPPEVEVSGAHPMPTPVVEEPGAPTTHAPVVRAEPTPAPEVNSTSGGMRVLLFVTVAIAAAAVAWLRVHHFHLHF